jgi:hypothetical protein
MIGGLFAHGYVVCPPWLGAYEDTKDCHGARLVMYNVMKRWYCENKLAGAAMEFYNAFVTGGVMPRLEVLLCSDGIALQGRKPGRD